MIRVGCVSLDWTVCMLFYYCNTNFVQLASRKPDSLLVELRTRGGQS
jgi:hypothetical protein